MTQILVFGDSIAYGLCDRFGGWVQRLRKLLDEKPLADSNSYWVVYNLGIDGNVSSELLERFESETKQRLNEEEETMFIFAIGINDSQLIHSQKGFRTDLNKFKMNIKEIVETAKRYSSKIIFVGLTPVDESKTIPIPWNTDKSYKNEYIQKYDEVIKSVCQENNIHFIEIFNNVSQMDYQSLLEDGLHPNSNGHQMIFEIIQDFLAKNKII